MHPSNGRRAQKEKYMTGGLEGSVNEVRMDEKNTLGQALYEYLRFRIFFYLFVPYVSFSDRASKDLR